VPHLTHFVQPLAGLSATQPIHKTKDHSPSTQINQPPNQPNYMQQYSFLRSWQVLGSSGNSPPLMEPEGSLPHSQAPPHVPILSQINSVHASPPHFLKLHFKIIIPSLPRSSKWIFSTRSLFQNHVRISPLSRTCHMPCPIPRTCEMFHNNVSFYSEEL